AHQSRAGNAAARESKPVCARFGGVFAALAIVGAAAAADRHVLLGLRDGTLTAPANPIDGLPLGQTLRFAELRHAYEAGELARYLAFFRGLGLNNISLDLPWAQIEAERGQYDFRVADACLAAVRAAGMSVQLKLNSRALPPWATARPEALMHDPDGTVVTKGFIRAPYHSLADPEINRALQAFYRETARRYRGEGILFYSSAFGASLESEYHHSVWTDFSPAAQAQLRSWLQAQYRNLAKLNTAWRTEFPSWEACRLAWRPPDTLHDGRPDPRYTDFIRFREWSTRHFFDQIITALKEGDPEARYAPQVGRIVGPVEARRGTPGVFSWAARADWVFVDPAPDDDCDWEVAVARCGGKRVAVELDGPLAFRGKRLGDQMPALYPSQTRQCYAQGADYVAFANWNREADFHQYRAMFLETSRVKQALYPRAPASVAVYVSKWDCYLFGRPAEGSVAAAHERFRQLRAAGASVDVLIDDVILANPAVLDRYRAIHLGSPGVVAAPVWERLQAVDRRLVIDPSGPPPLLLP
ncbi:MAG: beta-galactosidase, partial [Acidimicrobiia bacterium]